MENKSAGHPHLECSGNKIHRGLGRYYPPLPHSHWIAKKNPCFREKTSGMRTRHSNSPPFCQPPAPISFWKTCTICRYAYNLRFHQHYGDGLLSSIGQSIWLLIRGFSVQVWEGALDNALRGNELRKACLWSEVGIGLFLPGEKNYAPSKNGLSGRRSWLTKFSPLQHPLFKLYFGLHNHLCLNSKSGFCTRCS